MKAAVLGAGFIAEFHALGYVNVPGVQLCAACDVDAQRAKALAEKYGCAWYADAKELLERESPDLVSVCLPTYLHKEYVLMALDCGAHVLCEKPFALTMEDCLAMEAAAEEAKRVLMVGQVLRWWPEYVSIAENIRRLGAPRHIMAKRLQHPSRESWHAQERLGGGALFDLFVHDLDFVLSLMGTEVQVLSANGSRGGGGSWRRVSAMLRFADGTAAQIDASSQMPAGYPFTAEFCAQYPDAAIDYRFRTAVNIERGAKAETAFLLYDGGEVRALAFSKNAQEEAFCAEIAAFVRGAQTGVSPIPAHESVRVMRVVHEIRSRLEAQEAENRP